VTYGPVCGPRILVTGAGGFVGRHVVPALVRHGAAVFGMARGAQPPDLALAGWTQGDVRSLPDVRRALDGIDVVVHLACQPSRAAMGNPAFDFEVNGLGTFNVLGAAREAGVQRVVYTSTAYVYGAVGRVLCSETLLPRPDSPYGASKYCGEVLCAAATRMYRLDTVTLRLFSVYGPAAGGPEQETVEGIFVRRVARGEPPVIKSHPQDARDFIHIQDVAEAICLSIGRPGNGEVINIGSGGMTTLIQLARLVLRLAGSRARPILQGNSSLPRVRMRADVRKARRLLGFQARVSLEEGLAAMLERERAAAGT
jgi:UDP-glucose 4-epimerase